MDSVTIDMDEELARLLRLRAERGGRSLEEEARQILRGEVLGDRPDRPHGAFPSDLNPPEEVARRIAAMRALARPSAEPFDLKKISDELWDFVD